MGYEFNVEKVTEGAYSIGSEWFEENGKGCNAVIRSVVEKIRHCALNFV